MHLNGIFLATTTAVCRARAGLLCVLLVVGMSVSIFTFVFAEKSNEHSFELEVSFFARQGSPRSFLGLTAPFSSTKDSLKTLSHSFNGKSSITSL